MVSAWRRLYNEADLLIVKSDIFQHPSTNSLKVLQYAKAFLCFYGVCSTAAMVSFPKWVKDNIPMDVFVPFMLEFPFHSFSVLLLLVFWRSHRALSLACFILYRFPIHPSRCACWHTWCTWWRLESVAVPPPSQCIYNPLPLCHTTCSGDISYTCWLHCQPLSI